MIGRASAAASAGARGSSQTVKELMAAAAVEEKGFRPGVVSVVQTFGDRATFHPHVHALVSRGGWTASGEWISVPYVDEGAAEKLFRHKVLALLRRRGLLSEERIELLLSWRRSSGSPPANNVTPSRSSKPGGLPAHIPDPVDPPLVAIDRSETAYTVFLAVAKDASEEQLEQLRSRAAQEEAVELVTWAEFRRTRTKYLDSRIVHDDYPGSKVVEGIIELLRRYASTPFGLTWNGGVALTFNDYEHAKRIYKKYLSDPDEYAATRPKDPRRDPINPKAHFAPLLGWE